MLLNKTTQDLILLKQQLQELAEAQQQNTTTLSAEAAKLREDLEDTEKPGNFLECFLISS